jgi:hypothetical protein
LNAPHKFSKEWPEGHCETEVTVFADWIAYHDEDEDDFGIEIKITWQGNGEPEPEEWSIRWVHFFDYLAWELGEYLFTYSPAPERILTTLIYGGLPSEELKERWLEVNSAESKYEPREMRDKYAALLAELKGDTKL